MKTLIDIESILVQWNETTQKMWIAIKQKDYKLYRRCCSAGGKHFRDVKVFLDQNDVIEGPIKDKILQTVKSWESTVPDIKVWQKEIGIELNNVKNKRRKKNKIRQGYSQHFKTTGLNISRKAR
jgi:hypothetical protein